MTFVNMKASAFLVREERFNLVTTAIIFTGLIAIREAGHQVKRSIVAIAPPANQVQAQRSLLGKTNLVTLENLTFFQRISVNWLTL
jgi:hypothetical protein